jgi:hypothetical protein
MTLQEISATLIFEAKPALQNFQAGSTTRCQLKEFLGASVWHEA